MLVPDVLANAFDAHNLHLHVAPHSRDSGSVPAEGDAAVDDERDHTERDELPIAHDDRENDEGKDNEVGDEVHSYLDPAKMQEQRLIANNRTRTYVFAISST